MTDTGEILQIAFERVVDFLVTAQTADGHWSDFNLPVGPSDQWITALVGTHLAMTHHPRGLKAAHLAAGWLAETADGVGRWGYRRGCEPAADSTAWAGLLHSLTGSGMVPDVDWLLAHRTANGGFATYLAGDAWGRAHACVTPLVLLSLPPAVRHSVAAAGIAYLKAQKLSGGAWPAYWWTSCFYSTLWTVRCLTALGAVADTDRTGLSGARQLAVARTSFDMACAAALATSAKYPLPIAERIAVQLAGLQLPSGGFLPSRCLRVTQHWVETPGPGDGAVFADDFGLLTAATAALAFSEVLQCR